MKYLSTRGKVSGLSFEEAVMMGLADDGGLLLPETIPQIGDQLESWRTKSFAELSHAIISLFVDGEIPDAELRELVNRSYAGFDHAEVTPTVKFTDEQFPGGLGVLELFHGPTFAFKDVALQFLGNLFEHFLKKRGQKLTVLGATSGDTGSAAIYGLRGKENVEVFILHPSGRVSPVQERQMTSVLDANIHNVAIRGTFDDAQAIVKELMGDLDYKHEMQLGAVNSINWARVLAQIVYYFHSYFSMTSKAGEQVSFSVPTGNFGDILAGWFAKSMGLPVKHLVVATNQNDILHRFFDRGEYHAADVVPSCSPSMDIQISSNFERYLFYLCGKNSETLSAWMKDLKKTGNITLKGDLLASAQTEMVSARASEEETIGCIAAFHKQHGYVLDPHTAIGVHAAKKWAGAEPMICLATAHPAKFAGAVNKAIGADPQMPPALAALDDCETRCVLLDGNADAIQGFMRKTLGK